MEALSGQCHLSPRPILPTSFISLQITNTECTPRSAFLTDSLMPRFSFSIFTCVGTHVCMQRLDARNNSPSLFHSVKLRAHSYGQSPYSNCSGDPISAFRDWNYRWISQLTGIQMGSENPNSDPYVFIRGLTTMPSPQPQKQDF